MTQRRFNTSETLYRVPSKWEKGKSSAEERVFNAFHQTGNKPAFTDVTVSKLLMSSSSSLILDIKYLKQNLLRKLGKEIKNVIQAA